MDVQYNKFYPLVMNGMNYTTSCRIGQHFRDYNEKKPNRYSFDGNTV